MESLIISILKEGAITFLGCKITKAIGQKEISEILAGAGWSIVGIDIIALLVPIIKGINNFFDKANGFFKGCDKVMNGIKNIPVLSDFIKNGMVH